MKPYTVIISFALLAFVALTLFLIEQFVWPLAIAAAVFVLLALLLRK